MRVQDIMTTKVQTVSPSTDAAAAWELMRGRGTHHLVVTRGADVLGVFSARDAGGSRGASLRKGRAVADLMSGPVVTVEPDTTIRKAANLMRGRAIGSLVVTSGPRIAGIVTTADLLELLGNGAERPVVAGKRWTLKHRTPHRKRATAAGVW